MKIVVTLAVAQGSGYVYIHVGEATTGWWGGVDEKGNVVPLDFTACASLTFSSPGVANLFLQTCQNIISDVKQVYTVPVTLNKTN